MEDSGDRQCDSLMPPAARKRPASDTQVEPSLTPTELQEHAIQRVLLSDAFRQTLQSTMQVALGAALRDELTHAVCEATSTLATRCDAVELKVQSLAETQAANHEALLQRLQTMEGQVTIAKLNIEDSPTTPSRYGVRGIPTMMLFKDGQMSSMKVGAMPKQKILEWLSESGVQAA
jgi:hypothetical protein